LTLARVAWDCRSRSLVKGQRQTVKIVYALPFEPVVRSRSILGLSLPSTANGNCGRPLPVHWNCLFVSNQGAFNVSRVSGRSVLILHFLARSANLPNRLTFRNFFFFLLGAKLSQYLLDRFSRSFHQMEGICVNFLN